MNPDINKPNPFEVDLYTETDNIKFGKFYNLFSRMATLSPGQLITTGKLMKTC